DALAAMAGYVVLARLTIELASDELPTPLWAAVGWALGLTMLRDRARWPAIIAGAAAGELLNNVLLGFTSWQLVPALVANTVEMTLAAVLFVRLCGGDRRLDRRRGLAALLVAVAAAPVLGASIGALIGLPDDYWFDWWRWWRGDTLGYLIAGPLVMAVGQWWRDGRDTARLREAVALAVAVVVACGVVFTNDQPLVYLLLPLLSLCAYRFGVLGAAASTAAVVLATFAATANGTGPLAAEVLDHKTVAQLFFVGAALSNLLLAAEVGQARRADDARRQAEARYRSIVESAFEGIVVADPDGRITYANDRAVALTGSRARPELVGRPVATLFGDADGAEVHRVSARPEDPLTWTRLRLRRADGATRWVSWTVTRLDPGAGAPEDGSTHMFLDVTGQVELDERRSTLAAELALAAEGERRRLAADLHDGPIQRLAAAALRLSTTAMVNAGRPEVAAPLGEAERLVRETTTELRTMLFQLAPPDLTDSGLAMALHRAGDGLLAHDGIAVEVYTELEREPSASVALAAYRIAQEALTNVRAHAEATEVVIDLASQAGGLRLELHDNGTGCDPARFEDRRPGHLGVRSMQERATELGGWCRFDSSVGEGTTVTVWLPDQDAAPAR
ncbi:MAG: MASE1 domain-containing protein, partial [Acidimicrobiales bacterium]|nr:MASE1 domain-containing protein [Acidimicrobiales bacterium]